MYEYLKEAVLKVRWNHFFKFNQKLDWEKIITLERQAGKLPPDYLEFVRDFGEAYLFRNLTRGSYSLGVFASPRILEDRRGNPLIEIGFFINGGYAHFKKVANVSAFGPEVFEGSGTSLRRTADSFEEWFQKRFNAAQKLYTKTEWNQILQGPRPFTQPELEILAAMQKFTVEPVGTAPNGDLKIRVYNGSSRTLPCLTVDVMAVGRLSGTVMLNVSSIQPGESKIIEHDCYKAQVAAGKIELKMLSPSGPEERGMFCEFGR